MPAEGEYREVNVYGRMVRFEGCPISHIKAEEIGVWLEAYVWLDRWHLTPMSMGVLTVDRLDPRYFDVMRFISTRSKPQKSADGS